ncbi:GntR family transcriptional regulator [Chelatococcus reniformis]|uniref:GntR family transcriptional regulator n=1 Tax=Chelatococcus reniformis TaxID=1494448 RepID=A0A916ULA5_9HYPH|nr:GntR family transcriptional regulator [Chelatococcus reniformis]GGC75119.1 GntR family transcriptional regulator [Chelatococcus reniformis]
MNSRARKTEPPATADDGAGDSASALRLSSPDHVVDCITRGLISGRYVPGQRLVEPDLMREHKVSRGSVREALRRLSAEGLVTLTLHRGAYVRALSRREVHDVLDIVELLTGLAARKAALAVKAGASAGPVGKALDRLVKASQGNEPFAVMQARNDFHRRVVRLGGNHELERLLKVLNLHLLRVQFRSLLGRAEVRKLDDYERLAGAIGRGNAAEAELAGRRHVRNAVRVFKDLPNEAFAADDAAEVPPGETPARAGAVSV